MAGRPKCLIEGKCFAQDSRNRCTILTDCPREKCSFKKTPEQALEDRIKYGDGSDYVSRKSVCHHAEYKDKAEREMLANGKRKR